MKNALIIIDYQYDFVANDGKLTAGKATQNIEKNIKKLADEHMELGNDIIVLTDSHKKDEWDMHMESKSFPIHCEEGSDGAKLYGSVYDVLSYENVICIDKRGYAPKSEDALSLVTTYDSIIICGIITDICVLQTGILLYNECANLNKNIRFCVKGDCCASFDEERHKNALKYMKDMLAFEII